MTDGDAAADEYLHLGYEVGTGEPVSVPVMHTSFTGITRHGKSETMTALAKRAADNGYTVLLFDVKPNRPDFEDVGTNIPIYLEEGTDPTTLKGLLEQDAEMSLSFQYSELIKAYEPGDDYRDVLDRVETMMADDVHPVEEDKLRVLRHLLEGLVAELDAVEVSDSLDLTEGINVMDLTAVDDSIQQLAVASSADAILKHHDDVIVGIDEAHNFLPQQGKPPANDPLVRLLKEGGASDVWVWLSDQTITGIDKKPLKQVGVWLLGKQREKNEAKRVLDQIPGRSGYGTADVMTLDVGHFVLALDDATPMVYVQPHWMNASDAQRVATADSGSGSPDTSDGTNGGGDADETTGPSEAPSADGDGPPGSHSDPEERRSDADALREEVASLRDERDSLRERVARLEDEVAARDEEVEQLRTRVADLQAVATARDEVADHARAILEAVDADGAPEDGEALRAVREARAAAERDLQEYKRRVEELETELAAAEAGGDAASGPADVLDHPAVSDAVDVLAKRSDYAKEHFWQALRTLANAPEPLTVDEVLPYMNAGDTTTRAVLKALSDGGLVHRETGGKRHTYDLDREVIEKRIDIYGQQAAADEPRRQSGPDTEAEEESA